MTLFRFPYRWLPSTIFRNLRVGFRDVCYGIRNLCQYSPVIWHDRDWDWRYLAELMEFKIQRMEVTIRNGMHVNCHKDAKRLRICAILLKRLQEDKYFHNAGYDRWFSLSSKQQRQAALHASYMVRQDQSFLGHIIGKHLTDWWD